MLNNIEATAHVTLHIGDHHRLKPGTKLGCGAANSLSNRADLAVLARQHGHNPVGFTQLMGAQHDGFVTVGGHSSIILCCTSMAGRRNRHNRGVTALFVIPQWADLLAIGIGAMQGALFAAQFRDRRLDLLGVAIIGIATGFGGGILRDVLLSQVPAALSSNWYLVVAVAAALSGMLLERLISRLGPLVTVLDALTIGLFGAIGTTKALSAGLPDIPAIFVGVLSAVGGSILRDLLLNRPIALMHVGSLYALAAVAGTGTLAVLLRFDVEVFLAASCCVALTVGVRVLAVLFNWTLPEQRAIQKMPRIRRR